MANNVRKLIDDVTGITAFPLPLGVVKSQVCKKCDGFGISVVGLCPICKGKGSMPRVMKPIAEQVSRAEQAITEYLGI